MVQPLFSPLVPLTDALANTGKTDNHGLRARASVGSVAFVIGSALTGKLVSLFDYRAILLLLSLGVASMLLGMLLKPSVMPQVSSSGSGGVAAWLSLIRQSWRFLACVCLLQGRMPPTTASARFTGRKPVTLPLPWAIYGHWAWWRKWLSLH